VLPHSEMLPKIVRVSGQDSGIGESMKIHRPAGQYCRILYLVGKAEAGDGRQLEVPGRLVDARQAGSGGDQPAKESYPMRGDPMRGDVKIKILPCSPERGGCLACIQPDVDCSEGCRRAVSLLEHDHGS
jgi:hypothetical protein